MDTAQMLDAHDKVREWCHIGSSLIAGCVPKDRDYLVLVDRTAGPDDDMLLAERWMFGSDWSLCAGEYDQGESPVWCAVRKGLDNIVLTTDAGWYARAKLANEVCVALRLTEKRDRMIAYRVVRDGMTSPEATACIDAWIAQRGGK